MLTWLADLEHLEARGAQDEGCGCEGKNKKNAALDATYNPLSEALHGCGRRKLQCRESESATIRGRELGAG